MMDRDMWDQIERVLQRTCAVGRVEVVKVTAHQDTKEQKEGTKRDGRTVPSTSGAMYAQMRWLGTWPKKT